MSNVVVSVRLTENGEIPLPEELRLALGLLPRQWLRLRQFNNRLEVEKDQELPEAMQKPAEEIVGLEGFLALRGVFADDTDFDRGIEAVEQAWQAWTPLVSA